MAPKFAMFNSRPAKFIYVGLFFSAVLLIASWRMVWGWYYYYSEYYHGSGGENDIGKKCAHILREPNFWKRVQNSRDWWFRMRCEGNLAGSVSQSSVVINPLVRYFCVQNLEKR